MVDDETCLGNLNDVGDDNEKSAGKERERERKQPEYNR